MWHNSENGRVDQTAGICWIYWRGHQTSPTVVSLKDRLPEIMQSTSALSYDIIQIHSLFCHGFIKKPKSKFNLNCSDVTDFEEQILVLI